MRGLIFRYSAASFAVSHAFSTFDDPYLLPYVFGPASPKTSTRMPVFALRSPLAYDQKLGLGLFCRLNVSPVRRGDL